MNTHDLNFDKESGDLLLGDKRLGRLSHSEHEVLACLYRRNGHIVSREDLLDAGWPNKIVTLNSLNVAIKNIRSYLEKANMDDAIITHVKRGFSWCNKYNIYNLVIDIDEHKYITDEHLTKKHDEPTLTHIDHNTCDTTLTSNNRNSSIFDNKTSTLLTGALHNIVLTLLSFIAISLIIIHFIYRTPLECHQISSARLCGVGEFRKDLISPHLAEGEYLFGYTAPDGEFIYVKI